MACRTSRLQLILYGPLIYVCWRLCLIDHSADIKLKDISTFLKRLKSCEYQYIRVSSKEFTQARFNCSSHRSSMTMRHLRSQIAVLTSSYSPLLSFVKLALGILTIKLLKETELVIWSLDQQNSTARSEVRWAKSKKKLF